MISLLIFFGGICLASTIMYVLFVIREQESLSYKIKPQSGDIPLEPLNEGGFLPIDCLKDINDEDQLVTPNVDDPLLKVNDVSQDSDFPFVKESISVLLPKYEPNTYEWYQAHSLLVQHHANHDPYVSDYHCTTCHDRVNLEKSSKFWTGFRKFQGYLRRAYWPIKKVGKLTSKYIINLWVNSFIFRPLKIFIMRYFGGSLLEFMSTFEMELRFHAAMFWMIKTSNDKIPWVITRTLMFYSCWFQVELKGLWQMFPLTSHIKTQSEFSDFMQDKTAESAKITTLVSMLIAFASNVTKTDLTKFPSFKKMKNIEDTYKLLKNGANALEEVVISQYTDVEPAVYKLYGEFPFFPKFEKKINFMLKLEDKFFNRSNLFRTVAHDLISMKPNIVSTAASKPGPTPANVKKKLLLLVDALKLKMKEIPDSNIKTRQDPTMIQIVGPTSISKTTIIAKALQILLLNHMEVPTETTRYVYQRPIGQLYWPCYDMHNHKIVFEDEIGSHKTSEVVEPDKDPLTIHMQVTGDSPLALTQADVESKGKIWFNSPVWMATSNIVHSAHHMAAPDAWQRRWLWLFPFVRKEYEEQNVSTDTCGGAVSINNTTMPRPNHYHKLDKVKAQDYLMQFPVDTVEWANAALSMYSFAMLDADTRTWATDDAKTGSQCRISGDVLFNNYLKIHYDEKYQRYSLTQKAKTEINDKLELIEKEEQYKVLVSSEDLIKEDDSSPLVSKMKRLANHIKARVNWFHIAALLALSLLLCYAAYYYRRRKISCKYAEPDENIDIEEFLLNSRLCRCSIHADPLMNSNITQFSLISLINKHNPQLGEHFDWSVYVQSNEFRLGTLKPKNKGKFKRPQNVVAQGEVTAEYMQLTIDNKDKTLLNAVVPVNEPERFSDFTGFGVIQASTEFIYSIVQNNTVYFFPNEACRKCVSGLAIYDNVVILPSHFVEQMIAKGSTGCLVSTFKKPYDRVPLNFSEAKYRRLKQGDTYTDLATLIIDWPTNFKDIRKKFVDNDQISFITSATPIFIHPGYKKSGNQVILTLSTVLSDYPIEKVNDLQYVGDDGREYHCPLSLKYAIPTVATSCGSMVFANHSQLFNKILGMHVAGNGKSGNSVLITTDFIEYNFKDVIRPQSGFSNLTYIKDVRPVSSSNVSSIIKSPIYRSLILSGFEEELMPARLNSVVIDGCKVDPMEKRISYFRTTSEDYDEGCLAIAYDSLVKQVLRGSTFMNRPVLTAEQSVFGFRQLAPMNLGSSAGYRYNFIEHKEPGKRSFLPVRYNNTVVYPKYWSVTLEQMDEIEADMLNAKPLNLPTQLSLKDELLPPEKIKAVDTRIFFIWDLAFNLVVRKYFGSFLSYLNETKIDNGMTIGVNWYSVDAFKMYQHITTFKDGLLCDFDVKKFETSCYNYQKIRYLGKLVNEFYSSDYENKNIKNDNLIRTNIIENLLGAQVIIKDKLYKLPGGWTTGNILTAPFNSLMSLFTFMVTHYEILKDLHIPFYEYQFCDNYRTLIMGDDVVLNLSSSLKDIVTPKLFQMKYLSHGIILTDGSKNTEFDDNDVKTLDQIMFCSRSFTFDERNTIAVPLKMVSIRKMLLWIRDKNRKIQCLKENIDTAFMELVFHGREIYDDYKLIVLKALKYKKIDHTILTYDGAYQKRLAWYAGNGPSVLYEY